MSLFKIRNSKRK